MFTFTDNEILTNEKCFDNLYDLYHERIFYQHNNFKYKIVLVLENKIMYELPLKIISVKWAVALAEKVLHFFEEKKPLDNRPRLAIEAAKRWIIDQTTDAADAAAASSAAASYAAAFYAAAALDNNVASHAAAVASFAASTAAALDHNVDAALSAEVWSSPSFFYSSESEHVNQKNWSRNKLKEIGLEYLNNYIKDLKNTLKHLIIPEISDIIIKYVF